jgi:hypothetical protein
MTVAELIEKLKTMPQDMEVRYIDHLGQPELINYVLVTKYLWGPNASKPFVEIQ